MSGIEEKPIKQETPSLEKDKLFDTVFEECRAMLRPSRSELRRKVKRNILIDMFCFIVSLIPLVWNLITGSWAIIVSIVVCAFFAGILIKDFQKYFDIREPHIGEGFVVRG